MKMESEDMLHHTIIVFAIGTFSIAFISVLFYFIFITLLGIAAENQVIYRITWRFGQISMAESTGLAELLAELVGRFGQGFSTDSAIILVPWP